MLSADDVRAVLGDDHLDVKTGSHDGTDSCAVTAGDRGAKVTVVDTTRIGADTRRPSADVVSFAWTSDSGMLSVPVGHGWSGLFAMNDTNAVAGKATTTLTLTCGKGSEKSSPGGKQVKGLAVTVEADLGTNLDDPATRPAYVRIATSTAAKAARAYGCVTHLGDPTLRTVGLPVTEDEFEPLAKTTGTCVAVPTTTGVTTARETARAGAPSEACLLADDGLGNHRYTLQADFGPLRGPTQGGIRAGEVQLGPHPGGRRHGTTPGRQGLLGKRRVPGRRRAGRVQGGVEGESNGAGTSVGGRQRPAAPELTYARKALRAFAERSAKAHGCTVPTTP
ncbi:hypothetical protein [Streptomyces hokutonensis]|uniref:hypothetical protein n=1 Tax=Streptomyces hokutonensis TaxID=1306990 RepID=UPI0037F814D8